MDIQLFYTVISAVWGFLLGARDRLGEVTYFILNYQLFPFFSRKTPEHVSVCICMCMLSARSVYLQFFMYLPFSVQTMDELLLGFVVLNF